MQIMGSWKLFVHVCSCMCANTTEKINYTIVPYQYHGTVTYQMSITNHLDSFLYLDMSDLDMPMQSYWHYIDTIPMNYTVANYLLMANETYIKLLKS